MIELPLDPPEDRVAEGYDWSPKSDDYWDMRVDQERDDD